MLVIVENIPVGLESSCLAMNCLLNVDKELEITDANPYTVISFKKLFKYNKN